MSLFFEAVETGGGVANHVTNTMVAEIAVAFRRGFDLFAFQTLNGMVDPTVHSKTMQ